MNCEQKTINDFSIMYVFFMNVFENKSHLFALAVFRSLRVIMLFLLFQWHFLHEGLREGNSHMRETLCVQ